MRLHICLKWVVVLSGLLLKDVAPHFRKTLGNNVRLAALWLVCALVAACRANSLDDWTVTYTVPPDQSLHAIAFGNNQFVAAGASGGIATSADGTVWIRQTTGTTNVLFSGLAFGNGQFVVVGGQGWINPTILTSDDGVSWKSRVPNAQWQLNAAAYGLNQFVVVGEKGTILTSSNGREWVQQQSGTESSLTGIAFGKGIFAVVGHSPSTGAPILLTSADGISWAPRPVGTAYTLYAIDFAGGKFIAVGENEVVVISNDGLAWQVVRPPGSGTLRAIGSGNGTSVALADDGILTSNDQTVWTRQNNLPTPARFNALAYGNGRFVAVGENGSILASTNALDWTLARPGYPSSLGCVTYANGKFIATGNFGLILSSTDGLRWSAQKSRTQDTLQPVAYARGQFIACGGSTFYYSSDGTHWANQPGRFSFDTPLLDLVCGKDFFVATTLYNIFSSRDGNSWTQDPVRDPTARFPGLAYGNGLFVAAGYAGAGAASPHRATILTSPDDLLWTPHNPGPTNQQLQAVTYGQHHFVAVGGQFHYYSFIDAPGIIMESPDGANWDVRESNLPVGLRAVAYGNGKYIALGGDGLHDFIITSSDAIHWNPKFLNTHFGLKHAAYGNGRFVIVSDSGAIMASQPLITLELAPSSSQRDWTLTLEAPLGGNYLIQKSTDLQYWENVTTITNNQGGPLTIPAESNPAFFRASSL